VAQRVRQIALLLILLCGALLGARALVNNARTSSSDIEPLASVEAPILEVTLGRGQLVITGVSVSRDHAESVRQFVAEHFAGRAIELRLTPGAATPEHWQTSSLQFLSVLTALESATASMRPDTVSIRGVTVRPDAFAARIMALREALPATTRVDEDVTVVATDESLTALCESAFGELAAQSIEFQESRAEIRTSSHAFLDKLVEYAYDCHELTIVITGHSDASGDETWNQQLSLARAQAVADYLAAGGTDPGRLIVKGMGSTVPIADNETEYGRSQNRRIEFELQ
jgi:OOP family OmpA-OmpF porin